MKKNKSWLIAILLILCLLSSCKKNSANTISNETESLSSSESSSSYTASFDQSIADNAPTSLNERDDIKPKNTSPNLSVVPENPNDQSGSKSSNSTVHERPVEIPRSPSTETPISPSVELPTSPPLEIPSAPPVDPPIEPSTSNFNINTWIDFTKSYATSIQLTVDDNSKSNYEHPIIASPKSIYLERDIKNRLDDYKEAGYTHISVWANQRPDGKYDLNIGFA